MSLLPAPLLPHALLGPLAMLLHPGILALGAAAAAIPLIIHLLSRRKVRPVRWAAMTWLLAALNKHQRRLKLENLIVLLLRMAALMLLGLGLARLVLNDSTLALVARPKRSVILLLDTSYSTAARDGARSVSDRVRTEADKVLSSLGPDDTIVVVVSNDVRTDRAGTHASVLVPRGVGREGASRAKEALGSSFHPTEAPAAWPDALAACSPKAILKPEDLNRSLIWITDLQASDWMPSEATTKSDPLKKAIEELAHEKDAPGIEIVDVGGTGTRTLPNLVVSDLSPDAGSDLFQGHGFGVQATIENYGPRVEGATLRVFLDEAPAPARVKKLDPLRAVDPVTRKPGTLPVSIDIDPSQAFKTAGAHSVRVEISPPEASASADALGLDSRRYLALDVRSTLKILCWVERNAHAGMSPKDILIPLFQGDASGGGVFSLSFADDEGAFRSQLATFVPDAVILANRVPGGAEAQRDLAAFVRGGGALLVFPGDRFNAATWNAAFHASKENRFLPFTFGAAETAPRREDPSRPGWFFDLDAQTTHPLSRRWIGDKAVQAFLKIRPPKAYGRVSLVAPDAAGPRVTPAPGVQPGEDAVVLRWIDANDRVGPVAMAEGAFGQGHVLYAGFGLDDDWLDPGIWPFLPIILNDGALLLTRRSDAARNVLVGNPIQGPIPRDATSPRLSIPGRGEEIPGRRDAQNENEWPQIVYERVGTSGVWRLSYERTSARGGASTEPKKTEEAFAVNVDPREGSLLRAEHGYVEQLVPGAKIKIMSTYEEAAAAREEAKQGEVSTWILLLVAILLLLEPYLAMRFGRHGHTGTA